MIGVAKNGAADTVQQHAQDFYAARPCIIRAGILLFCDSRLLDVCELNAAEIYLLELKGGGGGGSCLGLFYSFKTPCFPLSFFCLWGILSPSHICNVENAI